MNKIDEIIIEKEQLKREVQSLKEYILEQQKLYVEQLERQETNIKNALVEILNAHEEAAPTKAILKRILFWK